MTIITWRKIKDIKGVWYWRGCINGRHLYSIIPKSNNTFEAYDTFFPAFSASTVAEAKKWIRH